LVEVIVVLVILAILAAIAIPALTGYINRARDKQYIMQARDVNLALHSVITEGWANGDFESPGYPLTGYDPDEVVRRFNGTSDSIHYRIFSVYALSFYAYGIGNTLYERAAALLGEPYRNSSTVQYLHAAPGSNATAATADGFLYFYYPEGYSNVIGSGKPVIAVTYKLTPYGGPLTYTDFKNLVSFNARGVIDPNAVNYDPNTGYEVYHLTL
jgi:type IV pilus assembly protein PilA